MTTNIKVAGTTFHRLPAGSAIRIDCEFEENEVPCAKVQAVLVPEPTNEYDPEAVKVLVPLTTGEAFHIGYVPREEPLKQKVKSPLVVELVIKDFGRVGNYTAQYVITKVGGPTCR